MGAGVVGQKEWEEQVRLLEGQGGELLHPIISLRVLEENGVVRCPSFYESLKLQSSISLNLWEFKPSLYSCEYVKDDV